MKQKVLIVDLNNFATFPTLAIGLLVASLRKAGFDVDVLCPLSHGVPAVAREKQEGRIDHWIRRFHLTSNPFLLGMRDTARRMRSWWINRPHPVVVAECDRALAKKPDILLLSAYLQHYPSVVEIGRIAQSRGIPMLLGGPVFNIPATSDAWRSVPGLTAIYGGEADLILPELVRTAIAGGDLLQFPGIVLPNGRVAPEAPPLRELDQLPIPDFSDFPWDKYRMRVIPLMSGRGCGWSQCVFCSDVVSVNGRTFRTRSAPVVLNEMRELAARHDARHFLFLDLKLNSDVRVWREIVGGIQSAVPGAEWIGTVHVDKRPDNGLRAEDLRAAVNAGMRRVSFGFETASQRLLDRMKKGSLIENYRQFVVDAYEAGLSVRCTAFHGFPTETAADLDETRKFFEEHAKHIDRIRFNTFNVIPGTPVHAGVHASPQQIPELTPIAEDPIIQRTSYRHAALAARDYRRAKKRLLEVIHSINRRPLRSGTEALDGLM
ncbi:B12-binding domain-containing radical SAM protein [Schlesneria sp.]|uniref:B12-binding domain-containing radical SAM protein n=1 Tax=Schlesneria sp. TaxID=2762018 RepID=UPI002EE00964